MSIDRFTAKSQNFVQHIEIKECESIVVFCESILRTNVM